MRQIRRILDAGGAVVRQEPNYMRIFDKIKEVYKMGRLLPINALVSGNARSVCIVGSYKGMSALARYVLRSRLGCWSGDARTRSPRAAITLRRSPGRNAGLRIPPSFAVERGAPLAYPGAAVTRLP
ncbi:hypothetical protein SBA3_70010 [Candidatus Sulfopaludibacter sp. SbA3]|nr:hypothetical protein SBA3_70010 [Candidatus Sulfopaludibacter sp. SbA3]